MRMTSKGQVTVPKNIRDRLGVGAGSEIAFVERADGSVEIVGVKQSGKEARRRVVEEWLRRVAGTGDSGLTSDEIMEMTRGPSGDRR